MPETQTPPVAQPVTNGSKSRAGLVIISLTAAVFVIAGVFAWYTSKSVTKTPYTAPSASTSGQQAASSGSLDDQLNAIDVESNDSDFSGTDGVDKQIQSL